MITRFESVESFALAARGKYWSSAPRYNSSWDAGISHDRAIDFAISGDEKFVASAEVLLEKIDSEVESPHAEWVPSIYGAYPIVPEYLAGSPTPMRHKTRVPSDASPVAIWVDLTCSGGFSAEEMKKRGVAILALVMKLQAIRPVDLYLVSCVQRLSGGLVVKIESQPISLGTAGLALCAIAFVRHLCYGVMDFRGDDYPVSDAETIRVKLDIPEGDLIIPGGHLSDRGIVDNPVGWVNKQVHKFAKREEE